MSYFGNRSFQGIDDRLERQFKEIEAIKMRVEQLRISIGNPEILAQRVCDQVESRLSITGLDDLKEEMEVISKIVSDKVLPQSAKVNENFGKVKVLEDKVEKLEKNQTFIVKALKKAPR